MSQIGNLPFKIGWKYTIFETTTPQLYEGESSLLSTMALEIPSLQSDLQTLGPNDTDDDSWAAGGVSKIAIENECTNTTNMDIEVSTVFNGDYSSIHIPTPPFF